MTYWGDLAVVFSLWGWAFGAACVLARVGIVRAHAPGQLIGLSLVAAAGWTLCLTGFVPLPMATSAWELLPMHPVLGPLVWSGGALGLLGIVTRLRRGTAKMSLAFLRRASPAWIVVALVIGVAWLWSLGPPLRPDEGIYHLSLPLQYARAGGYAVVEGHGNAGFFALGDMLFWWCVMAGAPGAARQMQLLVVLVGLFALLESAPMRVRPRIVWAFALWLLAPIVLWDVSCAYVDVMEAVFSLVAIARLARWYTDPSRQDGILAEAAWLFGAAAACRQLAVCALPALGLVVLWRLRADARTMPPRRARGALGAYLCCAVLPLLFVAHNAYVFGNPIYPFMAGLFGDTMQLRPSQLQVLDQFLAQHGPMRDGVPRTGLDALWHLPYALLFEASFASPLFDGVIGFLPLGALGVGIWTWRRRMPWRAPTRREADADAFAQVHLAGRIGLGFALLRSLVWLSTSWQARFLIMPLGALSLWACQTWPGAAWASAPMAALGPRRHRWRIADAALWTLCAAATLAALTRFAGHTPVWDSRYLGKATARHAARLAQVPASRLCERAAKDPFVARVMLVWTQRLAVFCPMELYSDSYDEAASLVDWLEADGAQGLLAHLHQARVSHLLVDETALLTVPSGARPQELARWRRFAEVWHASVADVLRLEDAVGAVKLYAVRPH